MMLKKIASFLFPPLLLAATLAGCGALNPPPSPLERARRIDPMLSAAGFHLIPPTTAEGAAEYEKLVPLQFQYAFGKTGTMYYWISDPYKCQCVFMGSEQAYQRYELMRQNQRLAEQEERTAREDLEARQEEEMNLQMEEFNPYGIGFMGPMLPW